MPLFAKINRHTGEVNEILRQSRIPVLRDYEAEHFFIKEVDDSVHVGQTFDDEPPTAEEPSVS